MSELAERSGVSAGTIKHYLREGLLGGGDEVVRTSRNMAYYPPSFVEQIKLIKRLQEERFMPLRAIRAVMERGPEHAAALVELEDRDPRARARRRRPASGSAPPRCAGATRFPQNVLDRLAELEVLTPNSRGYDADDVQIIDAMSRFRAGGYDEALGFTVFDTLRYREALGAARRRGGPHAARPPGRRGQRRARGRDHRQRRRAAARADRRDALQAAARRAAPPARRVTGPRRG